MQKPIDARRHGMMDYATVAATAAAPRALGFPKQAEGLAYGLAAGYLGLSLLTDWNAPDADRGLGGELQQRFDDEVRTGTNRIERELSEL